MVWQYNIKFVVNLRYNYMNGLYQVKSTTFFLHKHGIGCLCTENTEIFSSSFEWKLLDETMTFEHKNLFQYWVTWIASCHHHGYKCDSREDLLSLLLFLVCQKVIEIWPVQKPLFYKQLKTSGRTTMVKPEYPDFRWTPVFPKNQWSEDQVRLNFCRTTSNFSNIGYTMKEMS